MTLKNLLSGLILIIALGCNYASKSKPSKIPNEAVWKGGADGGCWILLNSVSDTGIEATIFYENGDNWYNGIFIKEGVCKKDSSEIIKDITGFDGQRLITNVGCSFKKYKSL